jgi:hypothetical protein
MDDMNLYDEFGNYIGPELNEAVIINLLIAIRMMKIWKGRLKMR